MAPRRGQLTPMGALAYDLSLQLPRETVRAYLVASHADRRFSSPSERLDRHRVSADACLTNQPDLVRVRHANGIEVDCELTSAGPDATRLRLRVTWSWIGVERQAHRSAIIDLARRLLAVEYGHLSALDRRRPPYR